MTLKEANQRIKEMQQAGLISDVEAKRFYMIAARKGDYGNNWSWKRQAQKRALWFGNV